MLPSNHNSLNNKVLCYGIILILVLLLCSCSNQGPTVYTVTMDANGGTLRGNQSVAVVEGMPAPELEEPTRSGYSFVGWYRDEETTIPYDFGTPTLYAKWTEKTWIVSFQSNGGTETASQSVVNGDNATEPEEPERTGFAFEGWYIQGTDTAYDFTLPVTSTLTLYAKWSQMTYAVTFDANLPDGVDEEGLSGMPEAIYNIPSWESVGDGYVFKGWYKTEAPGVDDDAFDLASDPVLENLTLYAKWSNVVTVTFNLSGGTFADETVETSVTVTYGESLTELPANPILEKDGKSYVFLGWYVDGEHFDISEPITSDTTVVAEWSESYFTNDGYFVYDAEGLYAWAKAVHKYIDIDCKLERDIILPESSVGESNWVAIKIYTGLFDGNGKTITNMTIYSTTGHQGMFRYIGEGGIVESLTLKNVSILSENVYIGAIAGENKGTIENCSISGNIKGERYVGGICGNNTDTGTITACGSAGSVEGYQEENDDGSDNAPSYVGGICGYNYGEITECYSFSSVEGGVEGMESCVSGICGVNSEGTISGCFFIGTVSGKGSLVGGICGENIGGTITDCYSTGSVKGGYKNGIPSIANDEISCVGGVCGSNSGGTITYCNSSATVWGPYSAVGGVCGSNSGGTITDCYSTGSVEGGYSVGGFCGSNSGGTITDCYSTGSVKGYNYVGGFCGSGGTITACYSTGSVEGDNYVGGFCGNGGTVTACYSTGSVKGDNYVGGFCGNVSGTITACCSTGSVEGIENVGGVCGRLESYRGSVTACYSTGSVKGDSSVGGVCGYIYAGTAIACYSTGSVEGIENVGGVCGKTRQDYGFIHVCYWSVPSASSPIYGIGDDEDSADAVKVDGTNVTWTNGDNSALSVMNDAISQDGYWYAENTDLDTSADMPLVLAMD